MLDRFQFECALLEGGYKIVRHRDEAAFARLYQRMRCLYHSRLIPTGDYFEKYGIRLGDCEITGSPLWWGMREGAADNNSQLQPERENATTLIIAWSVTYPFLWEEYLGLIRALKTVQVIILVPEAGWADLLHCFLASHGMPGTRHYMVIPDLIDIWVQDFVPLLVKPDDVLIAVEAKYAAPGTDCFPKYRTRLQCASREVARQLGARIHRLQTKLDWGNFVYCVRKAVLNIQFLCDNNLGEDEARVLLRRHLSLEATFIPSDPADPTHHADGTVRFIDEWRVFLERWEQGKRLFNRQHNALESAGP